MAKIQLFKKTKQTKAVNQIKKATSYMLLRRCNRCSSAVCLQNKKSKLCLQNKNQSFVYKTNQNNLFTNQLLSILSSIHRLHKSFIVGIQRNQNFRLVVAQKSVKQKPHMIFKKEISLVQYMIKKITSPPKKPTRKNE